ADEGAAERVLPDDLSEHVQDVRPLVVDDGPHHLRIPLDVAEAMPEVDGPLVRVAQGPAAHAREHVPEGALAPAVADPEGGRVLGERLRDPALVVVLPGHSVAPPLVRELVRT